MVFVAGEGGWVAGEMRVEGDLDGWGGLERRRAREFGSVGGGGGGEDVEVVLVRRDRCLEGLVERGFVETGSGLG